MNRIMAPFVVALVMCWSLMAHAETKTFQYPVQEGDTCVKIAKRIYGNGKRYDLIHAHNDLGPTPHKFKPGQVLTLPVPEGGADALLSEKHGEVKARAPVTDRWDTADQGMDLFRKWRVNTLESANAEVTFRDDSAIQMRQNTLVIIYGGTRGTARKQPSRAHLETGALRSKLGALAGGSTFQVETDSADATLESGSAVVKVDKEKTTRVSNHKGKSARVKGKGRTTEVKVAAGMGSKVQKGKDPTPPRPLPKTPEWTSNQEVFPALADSSGVVVANWNEVDGAESYYVEFAKDEGISEVIHFGIVPADIRKLEVRELPEGKYWATVAAIDNDQFESIPTDPRAFRVETITAKAAASLPKRGDRPVYLAGTTLKTPEGVQCASGGTPSNELVLDTPGERKISCTTASGEALSTFAVDVVALEAKFDAEELVLASGETRDVEVSFEPVYVEGVQFQGRGIEILDRQQVGEKSWRLRVRPAASTAGDSPALMVNSGDGTEVARLPVSLRSQLQAKGGSLVVGATLSGASFLSSPVFDKENELSIGSAIGGHVTVYTELPLTLDFGVHAGFYDGENNSQTLIGGRFMPMLMTGNEYRPYLGLGAGFEVQIDGARVAALGIAAVGIDLGLWDSWGLRAEFNSGLTFDQNDEVVWVPALQIGAYIIP